MMPHGEVNSVPKCFENVCRFCLSSEQCVPVFIGSLVNDYLMDAIDLLLLKVDENDGLPNAVCNCCYRILVDYAKFEARAIESYRILAGAISDLKPLADAMVEAAEAKNGPTLHTLASETLEPADVGLQCDAAEASIKSDDPDPDEREGEASEPMEAFPESATARGKQPAIGSRRVNDRCSKKKCHLCGKLVSQLSKHMPVHSGEKNFRCQYCGKSFSYDTSLRKHLNIHRGIRNYRCQYCDERFCDRSSLRYHEAKHREERKFSCAECSDTFFTASQLTQHSYLAHRERAFGCDLCGRKFPMKHHLEDHMIAHTDERPFVCTMCGKAFKRRRNMLIHTLKHNAPMKPDQ